MSVLTEIQRLTNAAAAIASAIAAKGVTVPSGTKLDGMAALINSILTRKPEQTKSCTPSESAQTISPDSGYALSSVSVGAISSTYVGSGITRRSSSDLTASGPAVIVPAGYYESEEGKSVSITTHPAPTVTIDTSTGEVTASHLQPAGYLYTSVNMETLRLETQAAKTVTPSTSAQTAVAAGKYTTGAVTVAAIPNQKSDSGNVVLNANTTSKSYAAGYYANAHGAQVTVYDGTVS